MYLKENKWTDILKRTKFFASKLELEKYSENLESRDDSLTSD